MLRLRRFKTIGCVLLVVAFLGVTLLFNVSPANADIIPEWLWKLIRDILVKAGLSQLLDCFAVG